MRALFASLTISVLLLASCGDDETPVASNGGSTTSVTQPEVAPDGHQARLDAARARWEAAGITDYQLRWTLRCFCPQSTFVDTIEDGQVVQHREAPGSEAFDDPGPKTMETIFGEVQDAIDSEPFSLEVDYDAQTGAVQSYFVDEAENIVDEEHGLDVELTPLDEGEPPTSPTVDLSAFTQSYGCGYGFQAGRPDQEAGLFLRRDEPASSGTVVLPVEGWSGEVQLGHDLFANWCDDVLTPDEPTPDVVERWEVVEGTLELVVPQDGRGEASVAATGLVAQRPDGTLVELGDITIDNPHYGTFAG